VELSWRHEAGPVKPFKLSLRLQDAGGALIAQNDSLPLGGYANFGAWAPGQLLRERAGLIVPIGTLPGSYSLRALVYDAASGQALGPAIGLGSISVDHAASQDPAAAELPAVGLAVGSARLEAAQLPKNGVIPGDPVPITLLWSGGPIAEPIRFSLAVAGQRLDRVAGGDSYPTTRWQARDVVRDIVSVRIPPSISAGTYPVTIDGTRIGTLRVLPAGRSFTPPPLAHEVHARFGDLVELLGFDSQPRAGGLQVQLVWQALNETEVSYTVFVHALAQDGRVASQVDQPPGTDRWVKGQVVTTSSDLLLPGPAADYRLEVGVYDAATGKRLPVAGGDSVILAP
jgi:hypothetical protein